MNSVIISAISGFGRKFCHYFKHSAIYRLVDKIHSATSKSWKNSVIIGKIKGLGSKDAEKKSLLYRIVHFPFSIFEKISKSMAKPLPLPQKTALFLRVSFPF